MLVFTTIPVLIATVLCMDVITGTTGQARMAKHLKENNVKFPPDVPPKKPGSNVPVGHLRPLGYQRNADGPSDERANFPDSPEQLYSDYVIADQVKPSVFRFALFSDIPDDDIWRSDQYLVDNYGHINVSTVVKKEFKRKGQKIVTIAQFINDYKYEDVYLTSTIPSEMLKEFNLPKCLRCGFSRYLEQAEVMMSSGDTASLLHSHSDHNLHCVLTGRKDFILIHPKYKQKLAFQSLDFYADAGYSELDMDRINLYKYPGVKEIPWTWASLKSRDCIYIPPGYLLQARSLGRSITTSVHWFPTPKISFTKCDLASLRIPMPMSEAKFMWTMEHGKVVLQNKKMSGKALKIHLLKLIRADPFLTFKRFQSFFVKALTDESQKDNAKMYWQLLTGNGSVLARSQLKNTDKSVLNDIARLFTQKKVKRPKEEL